MKKFSKFIAMLLLILTSFSLFSCNDSSSISSSIVSSSTNISSSQSEDDSPIYQGVSYENETTTALLSQKNRKYKNQSHDDWVREDFGELQGEKLSYYATKEEEGYLTLNFHNPKQYEILSFVLNGTKYQSFQFNERSTAEKILVAVTMPNDSGIVEYIVEQIKYIDGTTIKDVRMDGETSFKVGVLFDNPPTAVTKVKIDFNRVTINTTVSDPNKVITSSKGDLRFYLLDDLGIVKKENLNQGNNTFVYQDLDVNKKYTYIIAASIDLLDGKGKRVYEINSGDIDTLDYINFSNEIVTNNSISLDINKNFPEAQIQKVELVKNNQVVTTTLNPKVKFESLYSDTLYVVRVTYSYSGKTFVLEKEYTTGKKETPTLDLELSATKDNVEYKVVSTDKDNVLSIKNVEITKNGVVIQTSSEKEGNFENLYSDTQYEVVVTYSYDLYDGLGEISKTHKEEIKTLPLIKPTVSIKIDSITDSLVKGKVIKTDIDETASIDFIQLLDSNDKLVDSVSKTDEFSFEVKSNAEYSIVVNYTVNYNNGSAPESFEVKETVKTLAKKPTIDVMITKTTHSGGLFNVRVQDGNNTGSIQEIAIFKDGVFVKDIPVTANEIYDLESNTTYEIRVVYQYDLNDGLGSQLIECRKTFTTYHKTPNVTLNVRNEEDKIEYTVLSDDEDEIVEIDKVQLLLDGIVVKESTTNNGQFVELYNNTKYVVKVIYSYDLNDGRGKITKSNSQEIITPAKANPLVGIKTNEISDTAYKGEVVVSDITNTLHITKIELYSNDNLISTSSQSELNFEVVSNTAYKVVVTYTYDLNDRKGLQSGEFIYTFVSSKSAPEISFNPYYITQNEMEYSFFINDIYGGNLQSMRLYKNGIFISTMSPYNSKVTGLESNSTYVVEVIYQYDLDDGFGIRETTKEFSFTTLKKEVSYYLTSTSTKNSIEIQHNLVDEDHAFMFDRVELRLNNEVVKTYDSIYDVDFENLLSDTLYQICVYYSYDLNNGTINTNTSSYVLTEALSSPTVDIDLTSTKESISYEYEIYDSDEISTFKSVELFLDGKKIDVSSEEQTFNGLLSGKYYDVVITLVNDYKNGYKPVEEKYYASTYTRSLSDISFNGHTAVKGNTVNYGYVMTDYDNIAMVKSVEIYKEDKLIKESLETEGTIVGLLNNTSYTLRFIVEKDFNNGEGVKEYYYEYNFTTEALQTPSLSTEFSSTQESVSMNLNIIDNSNILKLEKLEIYKGEVLVKTVTEFESLEINELESNTIYRFVLTYSYDLNEGNGKQEIVIEEEFSTLAYSVEVEDWVVLNEETPKTNEDIVVRLDLNNRSDVYIDELIVNGQSVNITGGDGKSVVIFVIQAGNQGGMFDINIEQFGYVLNGFDVVQEVNQNIDISVEVLSRLNILSVSVLNGSEVYRSTYGQGLVIEIDNPDNYEILSYYFDKSVVTDVQMIDSNHIYYPTNNIYSGDNYLNILYITYKDDEGNITTRRYEEVFIVKATKLDIDYEYFTLNVRKISTPEELLALSSGGQYELMNDIDMAGYTWDYTKNFDGYFDGKGHSIKNISIVVENEYYNTQKIGLFSLLNGTFKNVYFENLYFNIQSNGSLNTQVLYSEYYSYASIENVVFSGGINYTGTSGTSIQAPGGTNVYFLDTFNCNGSSIGTTISKERFETKEFKEETLGWKFVEKQYLSYNGFLYTLFDDSYIIIDSYVGTEENVVVPQYIGDYVVVGIEDLAFANNKTMKSIVIPDLLYMGGSILTGCSNLEELTIGEVDKYRLHRYDFAYLFGITEYENSYFSESYINATSITRYIPNNLTTITLNMTNIDNWEVANFKSLVELNINNANSAPVAYGCTSLTTVNLNENITKLGNTPSYQFSGCSSLETIKLPSSLEEICSYTFRNTGLKEITIPANVKSIGQEAFFDCYSLTTVKFEENSQLTTIGINAFYHTNIDGLIIPDSVRTIQTHAFTINSGMVYIPDTVEVIEGGAFDGSNGHATFYCKHKQKPNGWEEGWASTYFAIVWGIDDIYSDENFAYAIFGDEAVVCKYSGDATEVDIPDSIVVDNKVYNVTRIYESTFKYSNITKVTVSASIKEIGCNAFYNCSQLESVVFEENSQLETICAYAFSNCTSLKMITIPANVKEIESFAFYNCYNLEKVTFEENLQLTTISGYAFYNCKLNFVDFTPIKNLTTIKEYALGSNNISGVYLPKTIKVVEDNNFGSQYLFFEGTEAEWQQVSNLSPYWPNTIIYNVETVEKVNGYFLVNGTDIYYIS